MAFDFPSSPTPGQTFFDPASGARYSFTNGAWLQVASSPVLKGTTSDAPPSNPDPGQLWWESDTGRMFIYYNDGNSSQWVQISGPMGVRGTARGDQNLLVNGAFLVSQENGSAESSVSGAFVADQWQSIGTVLVLAAGSSNDAAPGRWYGHIRNTTANAAPSAGALLALYQPIEGLSLVPLRWRGADAIPAVLNFKARASVAGTYSAAVRDFTGTVSFVFDFVLPADTTTWKEFTVAIPPPPSGTWNLGSSAGGALVNITHTVGATYRAPALGWNTGNFTAGPGSTINTAAANSYLMVADVQLLPDPQSTGTAPPFVARSYAAELAACQRYWQTCFLMFMGNITVSNGYYGWVGTKVTPRTETPAVSGINQGAGGFPSAAGTFYYSGGTVYENRIATATVSGAIFQSLAYVNARM